MTPCTACDAFQTALIHRLLPIVPHLTNMRQNVRTRTHEERALHAARPHRADYFATLPVGTCLTREALFAQVAGSPPSSAICAPMSFARPLYVVARKNPAGIQAKFVKEEAGCTSFVACLRRPQPMCYCPCLRTSGTRGWECHRARYLRVWAPSDASAAERPAGM
jgi:hypothetical protein